MAIFCRFLVLGALLEQLDPWVRQELGHPKRGVILFIDLHVAGLVDSSPIPRAGHRANSLIVRRFPRTKPPPLMSMLQTEL